MNRIKVKVLNAFVSGGTGGNPAGVVLDAGRFSKKAKQLIASKVGFSETAFISSSEIADFKLEFFTPVQQIADCGHATVAAFAYLKQVGKISGSRSSKETIDGRRDIFISGDIIYMEQIPPRYIPLRNETGVDTAAILSSLGLTSSDLLEGQEPIIANTGLNCLLVPLPDEDTLIRVKPDFQAIEEISKVLDLVEYYVFSIDTPIPGPDAGARMFGPLIGIPEEPATGMAAGSLACFLYDYLNIKKSKMIIRQGHLMNPPAPSELLVDLMVEGGQINKLMVGGRAVVTDTVEVEVT